MCRQSTTHGERVEMIERKQGGESLVSIAQDMGLSRYTVRKWWRKYRKQGLAGLKPKAKQRPAQGGVMSSFDAVVRYRVLRLKREHPHWGPETILHHLRQGQPTRLPSSSTISAYLKPFQARLRGLRSLTRRPQHAAIKVEAAHQSWAIDFKGNEALGPVGHFAPLMVVDEWTSAPLATDLYPANLKGVTMRDVQRSLRRAFIAWGLPDAIRMDRGSIFVGDSQLAWPGTLLLWLVGLGIHPIINDPGRPTQNAKVERQNRTWKDHVAVGATFTTVTAAQQATNTARYDRLYHLPSRNPACNGHPPMLACPDLASPRRPFSLVDEPDHFDFECVELYLAEHRWLRRVDQVGYISMADQNISLGRAYYGQTLAVVYDLDLHQFVASSIDDAPTLLSSFTLAS